MRRKRYAGLDFVARRYVDGLFTALQPLGVRLDQLKPDDCPKYLARCLESAPKEPRAEGVDALVVEVFDKVR